MYSSLTKQGDMTMPRTEFQVVEKANHLAIHCVAHTPERAQHWLDVKCPEYVRKGYFMNKALKADDFEIIEAPRRSVYEYY